MSNQTYCPYRRDPDALIAFLIITSVAVSIWWYQTDHLAASLAWSGFSPTHFVAVTAHPEWFAGNYPSGIEAFVKSAPMAIYPIAQYFGIAPIMTMKFMIGLEIVVLIVAAGFATKMLRPNADTSTIILVCLFMIAGRLAHGDLSRWGHPNYAWTYNFAYAGIIVGIAGAITRRVILSALALTFAIAAHAILGLLGAAFAAVSIVVAWREYPARLLIFATVIFCGLAGSWLSFVVLTSEVASGGIPTESFIALTRLMSFHWYPVDLGLFWERHWERLLPFLSVFILLAVYLPNKDGRLSGKDFQAACGFGAMLAITAVGVVLSHFAPEPFFVKLAMHRASGLFLVLSLPYIIAGLYDDIRTGSIIRSVVGLLLLMAPFVVSAGVPLGISLALGAICLAGDLRQTGSTLRTSVLIIGILCIIACMAIFALAGVAMDWRHESYTAVGTLSSNALVGALLAAIIFAILRPHFRYATAGVLLVIGWLAMGWVKTTYGSLDPQVRAKQYDYLATQLWARDHTALGSLFMPDPTHFYGWRDFSMRPSFGNVREWLHSGWIYNSRADAFSSGLRRVRALGIDPYAYLNVSSGRISGKFDVLVEATRQRYYTLTSNEFVKLAAEFGISYFVFDKAKLSRRPPLTIVYENSHFLVGQVN